MQPLMPKAFVGKICLIFVKRLLPILADRSLQVTLSICYNAVDQAVSDRLLSGHPIVAIRIDLDRFDRLSSIRRERLIQSLFDLQNMLRFDLDIGPDACPLVPPDG